MVTDTFLMPSKQICLAKNQCPLGPPAAGGRCGNGVSHLFFTPPPAAAATRRTTALRAAAVVAAAVAAAAAVPAGSSSRRAVAAAAVYEKVDSWPQVCRKLASSWPDFFHRKKTKKIGKYLKLIDKYDICVYKSRMGCQLLVLLSGFDPTLISPKTGKRSSIMNKLLKVMAISVVTALVLALPLAAQASQPDPASGPASNQRSATAEIYSADVDRYLNVNNWSAVKFDKWFGFAHGSGVGSPAFRANLGYATKLGDIYLGARYFGNIFQDTGGTEKVTLDPSYNQDTQELTQLVETTVYPDKWHHSINQLDVLIGVAGQGIRVGFFESMSIRPEGAYNRTFVKTDYQNGLIRYQNEPVEYSVFSGSLLPSVQWGTVLNVNDLTIKPRVTLSFRIFQDTNINSYYADYTAFNGEPTAPRTLTRANGQNNGYLQPGISVGADIGLPKKDDVATTFVIDYTLNLNIYDNDYSGSGFSGTAASPVSWTGGSTATQTSLTSKTTTTQATLNFGSTGNTSYFNHSITPRVTLDKQVADGLKLGLQIRAPVTITATSTDSYSEQKYYQEITVFNPVNSAEARTVTERTTYTPYGLTESTVVRVAPSVRIGASYNLIPSRFTVNAGVQLDPCVWNYTTITQSRNGDGRRTTQTVTNGDGVVTIKSDTTDFWNYNGNYEDSSTITSLWTPFTGIVAGGFVFNFNENIALDLLASVSSFNIDLAYVNVLFSFKF
jgi:hypothetical protein